MSKKVGNLRIRRATTPTVSCCGGSALCKHGRRGYSCRECGGKGVCEHGLVRMGCGICSRCQEESRWRTTTLCGLQSQLPTPRPPRRVAARDEGQHIPGQLLSLNIPHWHLRAFQIMRGPQTPQHCHHHRGYDGLCRDRGAPRMV
ncbi:hypothetical protein DFS34DRAFT_657063 [Phlyctochytrium arcticum]|nr:hypothetical protein DFS34DRAFT_657063 [Phlyctochytrium arcticum]